MKVTLVATTIFHDGRTEAMTGWSTDASEASGLSEFAGRACYQSWSKPNPDTATNEGYLRNILYQQHYSVLEHGAATFYVEDVSRALTHELVRHRHLSYSQLSQRYVKVDSDTRVVTPPMYGQDFETQSILHRAWERAVVDYEHLVSVWLPKLLRLGYDNHMARKKAREAARCVLPNMTPTAIVVSGNHRAWREMLEKRGSIHADAEIRRLAIQVFHALHALEPNLYQDFRVTVQYGEEVLIRAS
jgi:thymidylate synthase (FAD)